MRIPQQTLVLVLATVFTLSMARTAAAAPFAVTSLPFSFTDISATGSVVLGSGFDDGATGPRPIGFTFEFFGIQYTDIWISTNGLLTFGGGTTAFINADLTAAPTQAAIAVLWDDLYTGTGTVRTETQGAPGSRQFIVQWDDVTFFGGSNSDPLNLQAILFEGSNAIQFNYLDLVSGASARNEGAQATVGVKGAGTQGPDRLLLAFNDGPNAFVGSQRSTLLTPQVPEPATAVLLAGGLLAACARRRRRQ